MEDLRVAAWMLRYGTRSLIHNLQFIPPDRADCRISPRQRCETLRVVRVGLGHLLLPAWSQSGRTVGGIA